MPNPRTSNTTLAAQVAFRVTATERYVAAQLQLWVCAYCGYSELYTAGAQNLAQLADQGVAGVKRITRSSGGGAFR